MSWIEITATILGLAYVVLLMRENVWCWPVGNISVSLMAVSCFQAHLFADMTLQGLFFIIGLYGWYQWLHGASAPDTEELTALTIRRTSARSWVILACAFLAMAVGVFAVLAQIRSSALASADATLFSASIIATYMQAKKYIENWLIWVPINLSYAVVYHLRELDAYVVLSICFAALSTAGWYRWSNVLRSERNFRSL